MGKGERYLNNTTICELSDPEGKSFRVADDSLRRL